MHVLLCRNHAGAGHSLISAYLAECISQCRTRRIGCCGSGFHICCQVTAGASIQYATTHALSINLFTLVQYNDSI